VAAVLAAATALLAGSACSDDAERDEAAAGTTGGETSSHAGKGGSHSSGSGDDAGAAGVVRGGSAAAGAGETSTGEGGAETGGAGAPAEAGAGGVEPPGPAPGGGSVYAVECSGDSAMCSVAGAHCVGINTGDDQVGYSCSNQCNTVDDCSDEPSGAEATAGCVQFQQEKRCVLVCYDQPNEYACPDGMDCYIYPNSPIGYCLWMG
jgi:hypothetical protein